MAIGPMIAWRRASWDNLRRNFLWPALVSIGVVIPIFILGVRDFLPLLGIMVCAFVAATILFDTALAVRARRRLAGENIFSALATLARRNQRRYGGLVVHLGIVLIALGILGSMSYSIERQATLGRGETLEVGNYKIRLLGLRAVEQPTHYRVEGIFDVARGGKDIGALAPALKFFPNQQSPVGRAVHRSSFGEDLYLILSGFSELQNNRATLKVLVRPLVVWIWLGGGVIALGTLIAILPPRKRQAVTVPSAELEEVA
jgi:cytochrome c-type biogenesis protein CcmF